MSQLAQILEVFLVCVCHFHRRKLFETQCLKHPVTLCDKYVPDRALLFRYCYQDNPAKHSKGCPSEFPGCLDT